MKLTPAIAMAALLCAANAALAQDTELADGSMVPRANLLEPGAQRYLRYLVKDAGRFAAPAECGSHRYCAAGSL